MQGRRPRDREALGSFLPGFSEVYLQESLIFPFEKGKEKKVLLTGHGPSVPEAVVPGTG